MAFFSSSRNESTSKLKQIEEELEPTTRPDGFLDEIASDKAAYTPFELEAKERHRKLDALKQRANRLTSGFNQMEQLILDAEKSTAELTEFMDNQGVFIENEKRLKIENEQLGRDLEEKSYKLQSQSTQLEKNLAEIDALRTKNDEYRSTIDKARAAISNLREKRQDLSDEIERKNADLLSANSRNQELSDSLEQLNSKYNLIEEEHAGLALDLDSHTKLESELRQKLSENAGTIDEEIRKSKIQASELESTKRELSESNLRFIDLKSENDSSHQEIDYLKNAREDDQRKFDNRMFSLKSEIDSLSSERRINQQSLNEIKVESNHLKKSNREYESTIQRQKSQLDTLNKAQDRDRQQIARNNEKLSDLNLRYNSALTDLNHEQRQREVLEVRIEKLTEENSRLQEYRDRYDNLSNQVNDMKALVSEYQQLLETGRGSIGEFSSGPTVEKSEDIVTVAPENKTIQ